MDGKNRSQDNRKAPVTLRYGYNQAIDSNPFHTEFAPDWM